MTGVSIQVEVDDAEVQAGVRQLLRLTGNLTPLMRAIGVGLVRNTQDRFAEGRDPEGKTWQSLNPAYAAIKRGPGILRDSGMRGGLMGSITFATSGGPRAAELTIGTNKVYGAIHQFGGTIRPKKPGGLLILRTPGGAVWGAARKVTIPARPYLGFSDADRDSVLDVLGVFVGRALRG